jgi:hypothetical protein
MSNQLTNYQVRLHLLSPVHIGTQEELDPFSYVIRNNTFYLIDLTKWIEQYHDPKAIHKMMDSNSFAQVRTFIARNFDEAEAVTCAVAVDSRKLLDDYAKAVEKSNPENQVIVSPMTRNSVNQEAYVPGSSIKGAIRTAIASRFVDAAGVTKNDVRDYNQKIFGSNVTEDPMKNLKIRDVPLGKPATVIVEAKEFSKDPDKTLTPKGHFEATYSYCHTGEPVVCQSGFSIAPFELYGKKVDVRFILNSLNNFYAVKYNEEYKKFYAQAQAKPVQQSIIPINRALAQLKTNEALIRIGHFSHVECMTFDKIRNPKTRKGKDGKPLPFGTTRTLANGLYPFGWAKLEFLDLPSKPHPKQNWAFPTSGSIISVQKAFPKPVPFPVTEKPNVTAEKAPSPLKEEQPAAPLSAFDKLMAELNTIKMDDAGRLGQIIQKLEILEPDAEKGALAKAIKEKFSTRSFKQNKKKDYLLQLIEKGR